MISKETNPLQRWRWLLGEPEPLPLGSLKTLVDFMQGTKFMPRGMGMCQNCTGYWLKEGMYCPHCYSNTFKVGMSFYFILGNTFSELRQRRYERIQGQANALKLTVDDPEQDFTGVGCRASYRTMAFVMNR